MVQHGAAWCKMVKHDAGWCKNLQDGARWCKIVHDGAIYLLQYYNGGGVSRDPKFVLRNIWTAPKGPSIYYVIQILGPRAVSYTHLTLTTTPYV